MIRLVVALQAEARPLIDRFGLAADTDATGFRIFRAKNCALIVSGMGQIAAASATAYLQAYLGEQGDHPWVNIGVAGHYRLPLGTPVLAHKISVDGSSNRWYPGLIMDWSGETGEVRTLAAPSSGYEGELLYDMEAAGYYPTACRFSSSELVHCLKVVSDNTDAPLGDITRERVVTLVDEAIPALESLLCGLLKLEEQMKVTREPPAGFAEALQSWHFTVSQQHRLHRALRKHRLATGDEPQWPKKLSRESGTEVLRWLEDVIEKLPIRLVERQT